MDSKMDSKGVMGISKVTTKNVNNYQKETG